jgi:hypothetical protein
MLKIAFDVQKQALSANYFKQRRKSFFCWEKNRNIVTLKVV